MGLFKKMFKEAKKQGEQMLGIEKSTKGATPPAYDPENPPTRWEKAVVGLNGIVAQVSKIDPDGVDVVCFGGDGAPDIYRNVKDITGLEALVTAKEPAGACQMGAAMDIVLKESFDRGFSERPCSILVLTAGRPDDAEALDKAIQEAAGKIAATESDGKKESPLTITFVQVGDDEEAEKYLKHLDEEMKSTSSSTGEDIDIVDTIKDEEIKEAMKEFKKEKGGTGGAIIGAFCGAAMGVGGMYLYNKMNAKKRTEGWNGKWKATFDGDELATLTVKDDGEGNLTIEGWPADEEDAAEPKSTTGMYAEQEGEEGGYNIQFTDPDGELIYGTVEDEHNIAWSDGTRWEEIPPDGGHWAGYAGAAAAGAAAAGATGYLLEKKFFNKASKKVPSDYVIVLDRSAMMAIPDTGK